MSVTGEGAGVDTAGRIGPGRSTAPTQEARNVGDPQRYHHVQDGLAKQELSKEPAALRTRAEAEQESDAERTDEVWKKRQTERREREFVMRLDRQVDVEADCDLKRWLKWYREVGIHRDFARDYARYMARMSC